MDADRLRNIVRNQAEEQRAQRQREEAIRAKERPGQLWTKAREAVHAMEKLLEATAAGGCVNAFVYEETGSDEELGISFVLEKVWPWDRGTSKMLFSPPPFAEYVFNNCPQGVERTWHIERARDGRGRMPDGRNDNGKPAHISLEVRWDV